MSRQPNGQGGRATHTKRNSLALHKEQELLRQNEEAVYTKGPDGRWVSKSEVQIAESQRSTEGDFVSVESVWAGIFAKEEEPAPAANTRPRGASAPGRVSTVNLTRAVESKSYYMAKVSRAGPVLPFHPLTQEKHAPATQEKAMREYEVHQRTVVLAKLQRNQVMVKALRLRDNLKSRVESRRAIAHRGDPGQDEDDEEHDHADILEDQPDGWHVTESMISMQYPKQEKAAEKIQAIKRGREGRRQSLALSKLSASRPGPSDAMPIAGGVPPAGSAPPAGSVPAVPAVPGGVATANEVADLREQLAELRQMCLQQAQQIEELKRLSAGTPGHSPSVPTTPSTPAWAALKQRHADLIGEALQLGGTKMTFARVVRTAGLLQRGGQEAHLSEPSKGRAPRPGMGRRGAAKRSGAANRRPMNGQESFVRVEGARPNKPDPHLCPTLEPGWRHASDHEDPEHPHQHPPHTERMSSGHGLHRFTMDHHGDPEDDDDEHDHDHILASQPDGWHSTESMIEVQFPKKEIPAATKIQAIKRGQEGRRQSMALAEARPTVMQAPKHKPSFVLPNTITLDKKLQQGLDPQESAASPLRPPPGEAPSPLKKGARRVSVMPRGEPPAPLKKGARRVSVAQTAAHDGSPSTASTNSTTKRLSKGRRCSDFDAMVEEDRKSGGGMSKERAGRKVLSQAERAAVQVQALQRGKMARRELEGNGATAHT